MTRRKAVNTELEWRFGNPNPWIGNNRYRAPDIIFDQALVLRLRRNQPNMNNVQVSQL